MIYIFLFTRLIFLVEFNKNEATYKQNLWFRCSGLFPSWLENLKETPDQIQEAVKCKFLSNKPFYRFFLNEKICTDFPQILLQRPEAGSMFSEAGSGSVLRGWIRIRVLSGWIWVKKDWIQHRQKCIDKQWTEKRNSHSKMKYKVFTLSIL